MVNQASSFSFWNQICAKRVLEVHFGGKLKFQFPALPLHAYIIHSIVLTKLLRLIWEWCSSLLRELWKGHFAYKAYSLEWDMSQPGTLRYTTTSGTWICFCSYFVPVGKTSITTQMLKLQGHRCSTMILMVRHEVSGHLGPILWEKFDFYIPLN